jgi:uncharacterized protein (TIGR02453 family)
VERFEGFPAAALTFYAGLAEDNSKAYFDAHRETYETAVREPLELLGIELARELGPAKVFRPHRDVRFSRDKSPYKLNAAIVFPETGTYLSLGADGLFVGGGVYEPGRERLARIRAAIADDRHGPALVEIVADLEREGLAFSPPALRTAPRGFPRDHPRIELLRRTSFTAHAHLAPGPWLHGREALTRARRVWAASGDLRDWLKRHG